MLTAGPVVFLLDVDNTLLDNDRFAADLIHERVVELDRADREQVDADHPGEAAIERPERPLHRLFGPRIARDDPTPPASRSETSLAMSAPRSG
jgi:hypothetical protein